MKEATGELNATVIVVTTVGILSTFFFTVIWPNIKGNVESNTNCDKAVCVCPGNKCSNTKTLECHMPGNEGKTFKCPYKG